MGVRYLPPVSRSGARVPRAYNFCRQASAKQRMARESLFEPLVILAVRDIRRETWSLRKKKPSRCSPAVMARSMRRASSSGGNDMTCVLVSTERSTERWPQCERRLAASDRPPTGGIRFAMRVLCLALPNARGSGSRAQGCTLSTCGRPCSQCILPSLSPRSTHTAIVAGRCQPGNRSPSTTPTSASR